MKYWEIIADNPSKVGWGWAVFQRLIPTGEQSLSWTHRVDGKRFVVHADEKLTAFLELQSAVRAAISKTSDTTFPARESCTK